MLGIPRASSMLSHDVNAATLLAEASWRRDNWLKYHQPLSKKKQKKVHFVRLEGEVY